VLSTCSHLSLCLHAAFIMISACKLRDTELIAMQ
jgi:hypothetical protein